MTTFKDMLGINAGKEWDKLYNPKNSFGYNPFRNIFDSVRSFHLMEDDYPFGTTPATASPNVKLPGSKSKWGRMNNATIRYKNWRSDFSSLRVTLSSIIVHNKAGKRVRARNFPSKWYSKAEWGGDPKSITKNAYRYARAFFALFASKIPYAKPLIDHLEIGNEPWGDIGSEGYQAIALGFIRAYKDYYGAEPIISLGPAAFQAHRPDGVFKCRNCKYNTGDFVGRMLNDDLLDVISELNTHPYSFRIGSVNLIEHPESESSDFHHVHSMFAYRKRIGLPHLKMAATEFGWDSNKVGEEAQAVYIVRNALIMNRMGFDKVYLYEGLDNLGLKGLYGSSGLFTVTLPGRFIQRPKRAYYSLLQFKALLGDWQVRSAIVENEKAYIYEVGTAERTLGLVAWRPENVNNQSKIDTPKWLSMKDFTKERKFVVKANFKKLDGRVGLETLLTLKNAGKLYQTKDYVRRAGSKLQLKLGPVPYLFEVK